MTHPFTLRALRERIQFLLIEESLLFLPLALKEIALQSEPLDDHLGRGEFDLQPPRRLSDR